MGENNYRRFGNRFPLLIKFIDSRHDLSIQVHPDDETAIRQGMINGKNEMWYLLNSDPSASLRCGMKERLTPDELKRRVTDGTVSDAIAFYHVKAGDCFYIPAGRVHGIGSGCLLAEIQQTSDTTYRLYDYNRRDKNGNLRQLHVDKAVECIDYSVNADCKMHYKTTKNARVTLVKCPYFNTSLYNITCSKVLDYSDIDSFIILIGIGGMGKLTDTEGNVRFLHECESLLIPATTSTLYIEGPVKFLETYV